MTMLMNIEHLKLFEYCKQHSRGHLTPFELKFVDSVNRDRDTFTKRNWSLSPGRVRIADQIIKKLEQGTGGHYDRWQLPQQSDTAAHE